MIIACHKELKVGDNIIDEEVCDGKREIHTISFKVVRIATIDEYIEWCEDTGVTLPYGPWYWTWKYFYEIQTD